MIKKIFIVLLLITLIQIVYSQSTESNPLSLYNQARSAQLQLNFHKAIELYRAALMINPNYFDPLMGLAESFFVLEEYEEALNYLKSAQKYAFDRLDILNLEGRIYIALNDLDRARSLFQQVLEKEENNLDARFGLAELDIALGRNRNAAKRYLETLKLRPDNRKALLSLSLLHEAIGEEDAAKIYIELALKYHSNDPQVHYTAAILSLNEGNYKHAEQYLHTAISLSQDFKEARQLLSQVYLLDNHPDQAIQILREMLDYERNDPLAWYTLGLSYDRKGDTRNAINSLAKAIVLNPEDEIARIALENIALNNLPINDSIRTKYAEYHLRRGKLFESRNLLDKALLEYRRSLRLDPESKKCRLSYAGIYKTLSYPIKYQKELEVLKSLGYSDVSILDDIEIISGVTYDSISRKWKVDQYSLEKKKYSLSIFYLPGKREIHPNTGVILIEYIKDLLLRFENIRIMSCENHVNSYEQAFREARSNGSDYFLLIQFEESERSFTTYINQFLARTGTKLATYRVFRTGNNRIQDNFITLIRRFYEKLPLRGSLLEREFDIAVIDLGKFDGIKVDDELVIIKKDRVQLKNDHVGFSVTDDDILGSFTVTKIDEKIAEGNILKKAFFDLINPGDEVIFPIPEQEEEGEEEKEDMGLLRRLFKLIGL